jgi:hypothetical protein
MIAFLEYREGVMIEMGLTYENRKEKLIEIYLKQISKLKDSI